MRIWDVQPDLLCRQHLLGEHREVHALWNVITLGKKGYANHPETKRWVGKQKALYLRHELLVKEMLYRGYSHSSPLDAALAIDVEEQDELLHTLEEQLEMLQKKGCACKLK